MAASALTPSAQADWRRLPQRQACRQYAPSLLSVMPIMSRFFGLTITMYFDDHGPPHFHVRAAGHSAKARIDTLEVRVSDLPRRELRLVLAWAEIHSAELDENWRRAREGATLNEIEPLR